MSYQSYSFFPSTLALTLLLPIVMANEEPSGTDESSYGTYAVQTSTTSSSSGLTMTAVFLIIVPAVLLIHALLWCMWYTNQEPAADSEPTKDAPRKTRWSTLFITFLLTATSFAMAILTTLSCRFFVIEHNYSLVRNEVLGYGLFRFEALAPDGLANNNVEDTICVSYPESFQDEYFDGAVPIARWMAGLSCALLGLAVSSLAIWAVAALMGSRSIMFWRLARMSTYIGLYPTAMVFFVHGWRFCDEAYRFSGECELDQAGKMHIANVVLVVLLVALGFVLPAFYTESSAISQPQESTEGGDENQDAC